eukprot:408437-Pelagomonas_calceolata.AAC.1
MDKAPHVKLRKEQAKLDKGAHEARIGVVEEGHFFCRALLLLQLRAVQRKERLWTLWSAIMPAPAQATLSETMQPAQPLMNSLHHPKETDLLLQGACVYMPPLEALKPWKTKTCASTSPHSDEVTSVDAHKSGSLYASHKPDSISLIAVSFAYLDTTKIDEVHTATPLPAFQDDVLWLDI